MMMGSRTKLSAKETAKKINTEKMGKEKMEDEAEVWEVRPGGMLVQKRDPDTKQADTIPVPAIRVKVKYESANYEIYVSSQATFGEVKKVLEERTGLHPQEQKIVYKERERESREYLDTVGVRDKSKMVLSADPVARAKRLMEMRRASTAEKTAKAASAVAAEVDKIVPKVTALEAIVSKGMKVVDKDVLDLTEQLMNQLLRLDGIVADGDVKLLKAKQVRRVQKYIEILDVLKIKNAKIVTVTPSQQQQKRQPKSAVVTAEWELFDSSSFGESTSSAASTTTTASTASSTTPRPIWELF